MKTNSVSTTAATSEDATNTAVSWLPLIILIDETASAEAKAAPAA
jgi:hypothetical protein